jgi:excinuclease ABC subunit A
MTETNDYLKLLFPRIAEARCPSCSLVIRPETAKSIVDEIYRDYSGQTFLVSFGVPVPEGTKSADFFKFLQAQGYLRVWIGGQVMRTDEPIKVRSLPRMVPVVQDRLTATADARSRFDEAVETDRACGAAMLISRAALEEVGMLDDDLFWDAFV